MILFSEPVYLKAVVVDLSAEPVVVGTQVIVALQQRVDTVKHGIEFLFKIFDFLVMIVVVMLALFTMGMLVKTIEQLVEEVAVGHLGEIRRLLRCFTGFDNQRIEIGNIENLTEHILLLDG